MNLGAQEYDNFTATQDRGFVFVFAHFERNFVIYWNIETI